jgi:hypothetical protein
MGTVVAMAAGTEATATEEEAATGMEEEAVTGTEEEAVTGTEAAIAAGTPAVRATAVECPMRAPQLPARARPLLGLPRPRWTRQFRRNA